MNSSASSAPETELEKISPAEKVRRLLAISPPEQFKAEWTKFYATEKTLAPPTTHSLVIFRIGSEWLALPTKIFQEITERSPIHSLPHSRKNLILGLVRVRGELLIAVSLASLLGIESKSQKDLEGQTVRFIVLNSGGQRFVFPADEVFGVHRHSSELLPVPSTVANAAATYTRGLLHWRKNVVGYLDEQLLFHSLNRSLA